MASDSLVNLGDLTKPATVLIEKISDAIGGLAKPWQIQRVASAESKSEIIRAKAKLEITDIERRALKRLINEEGKKQENIERITAKAIPGLDPLARPEEIEKDWITYFFERSRLVSDDTMQELWANVLSSQANSPGRFSRRTIDVVSSLDRSDAELFAKLGYTKVHGFGRDLFIALEKSPFLKKVGINFEAIAHLENLGLIQQNPLGYDLGVSSGLAHIRYGTQSFLISVPESSDKLKLGRVYMTRIGEQILNLTADKASPEYEHELVADWTKQGLEPTKC